MINKYDIYCQRLQSDLKTVSTPEKAASSRLYFPHAIHCLGVTAPDIKLIISNFHADNVDIRATEMLAITEHLLRKAQFNEEILLAFGLINKFVKQHYNDDLLLRFEFWLENYATNWSLVDDLCIKKIYQFLLARPHLIEHTQHWANSKVSWCRRGSNVVWVKFVKRKIAKSTYYLDKELIFKNCNLLINDKDEFVQKSIGWLLKVTSVQHKNAVVAYIENNIESLTRPTLRYAIEKMDVNTRKELLSRAKYISR